MKLLDKFHEKYCDYVLGAPGSFQWKKDVTPVAIEIFLSQERQKLREEIEKMKEEWVIKSSGTGKIDGRAIAFVKKGDVLTLLSKEDTNV